MQISKEDLNYLYWGDETEQIVATLTNKENPLDQYIKNITSATNMNINNVLYTIKVVSKIPKWEIYYLTTYSCINKDQLDRLYKLDDKYKFKSYDEDTQAAIILLKEHYCFNDFLKPQKLDNTVQKIEKLLKQYKYKRDNNEIKNMIKDAFGYL